MNRLKTHIKGSFLLFSGKYKVDVDTCLFDVHPNFYYLTKINIPNYAILFNHKTKKYTHFYKFNDPIWVDDKIYFKNSNVKIHDIKEVNNYIKNIKKLYTLSNIKHFYGKLNVSFDNKTIDDICNIFRISKNKEEIENIKKASQLTCSAVKYVMKNLSKINNEKDLVSFFKKKLLEKNIFTLAFHPICSNGRNNSILHYTYNKNKLLKNSLVLMDVGCKYKQYCSDVTRTFPRNGKFTEKQRNIYNIVLECQKKAIKHVKHNADWKELEDNIRIMMFDMLHELNLVYHVKSRKKKIKVTKLFMPHGLGHSIGLETHDPEAKDIMNILKKNMVITIEPGIYFIDELIEKSKKINIVEVNKYRNIGGIRIEDVVLVNTSNCSILSNIPKEMKAVEKLIK